MSINRILPIIEFDPVAGYCYLARLPEGISPGDSLEDPYASELMVFEDGVGLGPPHAQHAEIGTKGAGAFSHWQQILYFSARDNSDPRTNGRKYQVYLPASIQRPSHARAVQVLRAMPNEFTRADAYQAIETCLSLLYPEAKIGDEAKSFWYDHRFLCDYQRLCGNNYRSLERKYVVFNLVKATLRVGGDMAECGTYGGGTAHFMALARQSDGKQCGLYLFDSFEGLSAPGPQDGSYWHSGSLAISEGVCRRNLSAFGGVHILRGWIPERFAEVADRRFCFVHIDVDLYQPTKDSIEFFYPRLQPGAMLVCDDYGFETCPGARQAMDEYFRGRLEQIIHLPTGQGLVIKPS
jgi:hypothetical protein